VMMSSADQSTVFVNCCYTVKPAIHFWLLTLHYQPFVASTIASFITIIGYIAVADSMAYLTRLFKKP